MIAAAILERNAWLRKLKMAVTVNVHEKKCGCSYCSDIWSRGRKMRYGLNIPPAWKEWNSWYVIKFGPRHYFRWTNSWLRMFRRA
jgi:hypothetical protein